MRGKARDFETLISAMGPPEPLSDDQFGRARLLVCANSENAEEASELMQMLGIYPGRENEDTGWDTPQAVANL
ncbi:hypothetical protein SEA_PUPPER_175 [Gordonia phage Pupper]|uniref:Uncharacterized protein n=1 Tax=Gordonia phage Pupper TaxID=2571249 RepID=A0A4Y6EMM5_9CAUD|nr:hypothetical protein KHQ83_gp102 [Gordonia phage Pupper]QDF18661.1 hypothetical protein SEA_PUPPER_175 [Gordonia phage Pupper]QDF18893.1 hypothetical protein SEA_SCENTAE_174 [Gordonia phage SCentae]